MVQCVDNLRITFHICAFVKLCVGTLMKLMTIFDLHICKRDIDDINDSLRITFNFHIPHFPRFAIASRDIVVGEVLTVEKAIVSHMLPEYMVIIFATIILLIISNSMIVFKMNPKSVYLRIFTFIYTPGAELYSLFQIDEGSLAVRHLYKGSPSFLHCLNHDRNHHQSNMDPIVQFSIQYQSKR